jgi:hypothetical protein
MRLVPFRGYLAKCGGIRDEPGIFLALRYRVGPSCKTHKLQHMLIFRRLEVMQIKTGPFKHLPSGAFYRCHCSHRQKTISTLESHMSPVSSTFPYKVTGCSKATPEWNEKGQRRRKCPVVRLDGLCTMTQDRGVAKANYSRSNKSR